jgi:putative NADH-flavin reductase
MTIGVFGANGKTGVLLVKEALERGHKVIAGVRGKHAFKTSEFLEIVPCDILNPEQVNSVVEKSDVITSVVGHVKGSPEFVQSEGISNIINSIEKLNKKRLVSLTGTGVRFKNDKITLIDRILNISINLIDPKRIADGKKHVQIIKDTNLEWTIVRVLKLQNTKALKFTLTENGPTKIYTSRHEVATAIIDVLENETFIKKAPIISKFKNNHS